MVLLVVVVAKRNYGIRRQRRSLPSSRGDPAAGEIRPGGYSGLTNPLLRQVNQLKTGLNGGRCPASVSLNVAIDHDSLVHPAADQPRARVEHLHPGGCATSRQRKG